MGNKYSCDIHTEHSSFSERDNCIRLRKTQTEIEEMKRNFMMTCTCHSGHAHRNRQEVRDCHEVEIYKHDITTRGKAMMSYFANQGAQAMPALPYNQMQTQGWPNQPMQTPSPYFQPMQTSAFAFHPMQTPVFNNQMMQTPALTYQSMQPPAFAFQPMQPTGFPLKSMQKAIQPACYSTQSSSLRIQVLDDEDDSS